MVALRKGDGRVRGLVLGDTFRRLLSRTLAQTFGAAFDAACAPHQFALSTRAGAEALTRAVRARLALDDQATLVSVDGVGAYDHVSRAAILAALHQNPHLTELLPYVRQFYASPSSYVWYDRHCAAHHVAAAQRKRRYVYPELRTAARCRLVIIALEIGGRWSDEAADFIRRAASARARGDPVSLRRAAAAAYAYRWVGIASVAAQRALASSLLELPVSEDGVDGEEADFPTVLAEASWEEPPAPSRLGPR